MDRDNRWERVERAYDAVVCAEPFRDLAAVTAMEASYASERDRRVRGTRGLRSPAACATGTRSSSSTSAPTAPARSPAPSPTPTSPVLTRKAWPSVHFVCLTEYDPEIPAAVAFPKEFPENVLADVLADAGLAQYHIAETEKYAHVTFFLNGGREAEKAGESRRLIASPKVATYDLQPEMSEPEVADTLAAAIDADEADVYIVNFANCDMVGHTGVVDAARAAVEAVDAGVGQGACRHRAQGRRGARHGRPRQRRQDDRRGRRRVYGAHHQPGAACARGCERVEPEPFPDAEGCLADIAPDAAAR